MTAKAIKCKAVQFLPETSNRIRSSFYNSHHKSRTYLGILFKFKQLQFQKLSVVGFVETQCIASHVLQGIRILPSVIETQSIASLQITGSPKAIKCKAVQFLPETSNQIRNGFYDSHHKSCTYLGIFFKCVF